MKHFILMLLVAMAVMPAGSQTPQFEVVSIKSNRSNSGRSGSGYRPGGVYVATNVSLKFMITEAYGIRDFQLEGGPNWLDKDRFDIEARGDAADTPDGPNVDRVRILFKLRSVLESRFELKTHQETRELPIYALVTGKAGPKLTVAEKRTGQCGVSGGPRCAGIQMRCCQAGMADLVATDVSIPQFVETLSQMLSRQVIDKTNIQGAFDMKLRWLREDVTPVTAGVAGEPEGPSLFTVIQEQLGLKLESTKGPVQVLIIDHAEKPSEN